MVILLFTTENNTLLSRQDERVSPSLSVDDQMSVEKSTASLKPLNILVHFECGEFECPMRITANSYDQFYDKVVSTVKSKTPGFTLHSMQFQCGSKWYDFKKDTEFDYLCLNEENPEVSIRATPKTGY